jgi:hypothetical protein
MHALSAAPSLALAALLCLSATHATTTQASDPDGIVALIAEEAHAYGISPSWLLAVALCETGGTLRTDLVGRQGEIGLFQWHPYGLWRSVPIFTTWGDVYDVRLNVRGAAWAFARGWSSHWSCAR